MNLTQNKMLNSPNLSDIYSEEPSEPIVLFQRSFEDYIQNLEKNPVNRIHDLRYWYNSETEGNSLENNDRSTQQNLVLIYTLTQLADKQSLENQSILIAAINKILEDPRNLKVKEQLNIDINNIIKEQINSEKEPPLEQNNALNIVEEKDLNIVERKLRALILYTQRNEGSLNSALSITASTAINSLPFPLNAFLNGSLHILSGHENIKIFKEKISTKIAKLISKTLTQNPRLRNELFELALSALLSKEERKRI